MFWFSSKSQKTSHRSVDRTANKNRLRPIERLENRELMAADTAVIWDTTAPPNFKVQVEGTSLVFYGADTNDKVSVHDIVANKAHKKLSTGKEYIEIQHQDDRGLLRRGWVKQNDNLYFTFYGNKGNDHFQYIDTSGDPKPRRDRRIIAYGGDGNDSLHGYNQNDILFGDDGIDDLLGELGSDLLYGGKGDDRLWGDGVTRANSNTYTDPDYLTGGPGRDELYGWQGSDTLNGGDYWKVNDAAIDALYGGSEGDCFYVESFPPPYAKEARDYSQMRLDRVSDLDFLATPPTFDQWIGQFQGATAARPLNMTAFPEERALILKDLGKALPNLGQNYEVIGPSSQTYNCIAASMGIYDRDVWPDDKTYRTRDWFTAEYKKAGFEGPVDYNSAAGRSILANKNLEVVVVYGVTDTSAGYKDFGYKRVTHAAVRQPDGAWVSKLGDYAMIRHKTPEALSGVGADGKEFYGKPLYLYYRTAPGCGCF